MGLMPSILYIGQPQNSVVRRKSSVRNQRLNAEHEKWLRSMGYI